MHSVRRVTRQCPSLAIGMANPVLGMRQLQRPHYPFATEGDFAQTVAAGHLQGAGKVGGCHVQQLAGAFVGHRPDNGNLFAFG